MDMSTTLARAIRLAIGLSAAMAAPLAMAQETEEIVVTGSRIARSGDFESPSPIITVDREAIDKSGYNNLQQVLEKIPASGNGTFSTRGNNQDSTGNGGAAVSLRGLGADATLVLVNGRRVSVSPFAESITTNFVDINSIPVSAIERVEVLKDGASAVYGSDAVAGVVNIVLRDNFEGFEVGASYGDVTSGSNAETTASAIWGTGGDNGNVTMIFDYFKNDTLFNTERGSLGSADQSARGGADQRSSRSYPGSFIVDGVQTVDPTCPPDRTSAPNCFFDYGPFNMLMPESERTGLLVLGTLEMGAAELFTEVAVQHNTSVAEGAPTPLDDTAGLTVPGTHPGNPFLGANEIIIRRYRTVDAGPRLWDIESDNLRLLAGLRGEISDDWNWEVAAQRGRAESEQTGSRSMGWVRTDFLQEQINLGNYNPFSTTANPQSVINDITTSLVRRGKSDLTSFDASVNGSLFDLSAGPVLMAAGLEYREESVSDIPDDQFQRGLIFGTESVAAGAERDISSAYVEFSVPLLESVELQVAGRYDDYSDFGDTVNPKAALRWEVTDNFALRTSWGQGFRAPSLAQIGLGPSKESQFFVDRLYCVDQGVDPNDPDACPLLDYLIEFTGNAGLEAEESENFNVGLTWQPLDSLDISVDYWDILQENKIDEEPFGALYSQFCDEQDNPRCTRAPALPGDTLGELQQINGATFINIGEQSVQGIDLAVAFATEVGSATMTLGLDYSHLLEFERVESNLEGTGLVTRSLAGEYEYPEDRFVLTNGWQFGDLGVFALVNYIGEFEDTPDANQDGLLDYDTVTTRKVDSFVTLNLQVSYDGIKNTKLMLGVDNALDENPPFAIGDFDTDLYGYVASQHSPRGRFIYTKMTYSF
jgi:iron complex outermembrane recepter protein